MLKKEQKKILEEIFRSPLAKIASWGGGTALSEIYLRHRKSEDIDIILTDMPETIVLTSLTDEIKNKIKAATKESFINMNRFQYVFNLKNGSQQKLEFVFYPFPKLDRTERIGKIKIESLLDIAASKILSAYQRKEVKDAYDIFILLKEKKFTLDGLIPGVEKKFGEKIDSATLLAKLNSGLENFEALEPMLIGKKSKKKEVSDFFQREFDSILRKQKL